MTGAVCLLSFYVVAVNTMYIPQGQIPEPVGPWNSGSKTSQGKEWIREQGSSSSFTSAKQNNFAREGKREWSTSETGGDGGIGGSQGQGPIAVPIGEVGPWNSGSQNSQGKEWIREHGSSSSFKSGNQNNFAREGKKEWSTSETAGDMGSFPGNSWGHGGTNGAVGGAAWKGAAWGKSEQGGSQSSGFFSGSSGSSGSNGGSFHKFRSSGGSSGGRFQGSGSNGCSSCGSGSNGCSSCGSGSNGCSSCGSGSSGGSSGFSGSNGGEGGSNSGGGYGNNNNDK